MPLIFDWEDGTDFSGISYYRLIIDDEVDPYTTPGFVFEVNIINLGPNSSYYRLEEELEPGEYYYFVYQIDGANHQSNSFSGRFTIGAPKRNSPAFPFWIIFILIGAIVGLTLAIVAVKRTKKEKVKILVIDKELDKLKESRKLLEAEAMSALKANDYGKAIGLYEECAKISYNLYEEGDKLEQSKYKYYKDLELEAKGHLEAIPLRNACINNILTRYFDEIQMNYYSDPQIYPENQETINGLILNDIGFLQIRLTKMEDGTSLAEQLEIDPTNIDHINAIQIIYSIDLSVDAILNYSKKFQNPEMMLLIVGLEWPTYHYEERMNVPKDKDIKYTENIKVINLDLFSRIFDVKDQYQSNLMNVINLKDDLKGLKELYESTKIDLHDTNELKKELKQKEWFFLI